MVAGKSEEVEEVSRHLEAQARLLDLTHDSVIVRDMDGAIQYWNRGAEEAYGWTRAEAVGQAAHKLLQTRFPEPLEAIHAKLLRDGRWEGELIHARRDGTGIVVSSRWVLERDERGHPVRTLEINNDLSEQRKAEAELRRFFALSLDMLCIAGFDGYLKRASPATEHLFGYTQSELLSQPFLSFVHPDEHPAWIAELGRLAAGEETHGFESRGLCKDGSYKWILWNATSHLGQKLIYAAGRDITERKQAEAEMREMLAAIVKSSDDAIISKDLNGTILSWNKGAENVYGYSAEEVKGKSVSLLTPPDLPDELPRIMERLKRGERTEHYETVRLTKQGRRIDVSMTISPLRDAAGRVTGASSIGRDITEQKLAQQRLRDSEERYRLLFESNPVPLWVFGLETKAFLAVNNAAIEHYGYSREEFLSMTILDIRPPEDIPVLLRRPPPREGCLYSAGTWSHRKKDGTVIDVDINAYPLVFEGRRCELVLANDVTERKRVEDEVRKLNEQLEERVRARTAQLQAVNQELEAFTYSVSHDLRAPLRHVDGFARILVEEYGQSLEPAARGHLQRVRAGAQQMGRLIDDLLNLARVGRQQVSRRMTGLDSLVEEVLKDMGPDMGDREIDWQVGELPCWKCDPGLIRQVFVNLLSNAVKYTRPRPRAVIQVGAAMVNGETAIFVRDNGVGFNMKHADKLFGVFQRLHRAEDFEGTGVGLATVQRIVHKHGGRIWAEAELDQGATFYFTLGRGGREKAAGSSQKTEVRRQGIAHDKRNRDSSG